MTQQNVNRPGSFSERFSNAFKMQRQYWSLWLKSRLRRTRLPQVFMILAGVLVSAPVLGAVMATIVIFDIVMLLVSAIKKPFRPRRNLHFPSVRANV